MALVVFFDFTGYLFFCLIIDFPDKILIKTHGPFLKTNFTEPVKKPLFGYFQILSIDMKRIGMPV